MDAKDFLLKETQYCQEKYDEIERLLLAPEITADAYEVKKLSKRKAFYGDIIKLRKEVCAIDEEINGYKTALSNEADEEYSKLLSEEILSLKKKSDDACLKLTSSLEEPTLMKMTATTNDERKKDLLNAYVSFARRLGYDVFPEEDGYVIFGGLKVMSVANAVHRYIGEKGVRIQVVVFPYVRPEVKLDKKDVRVDIFLSHGKGGQNINKVETAVRLTYLPKNIVVTCQDERSQLENKKRAFEKLEEAVKRSSFDEAKAINSKEYEKSLALGGKRYFAIDIEKGSFTDDKGGKVSLKEFFDGDISALATQMIIGDLLR